MKLSALILAAATTVSAQTNVPIARVADDARVIDRVAEASRRDLPSDLLRRIVNEDIDSLRGKRSDGTYQYAGYEKMESGRVSQSYSVEAEKKDMVLEVRGPFVYRVVITVPSRRMLVTRNRRVYIDRVEIEYIPQNDTAKKAQAVTVGEWIEPGGSKNIELNEIARQATVRVHAHADPAGYGNLSLTLIQARVFDDPNSPYADAVASEKAILRAIDHDDAASMRAMAQRIVASLQAKLAVANVDVIPQPAAAQPAAAPLDAGVYTELQAIEDLLTGNDAERRQGLDRLHQLVRRLRQPR